MRLRQGRRGWEVVREGFNCGLFRFGCFERGVVGFGLDFEVVERVFEAWICQELQEYCNVKDIHTSLCTSKT